MSEPAIKRLGTFLADLTADMPPDQIHQQILERLRDPDQDLDHRLAGIYLHLKDFLPIWTAIRNGVSLPASSWETVVLPVVVHFSPAHNLKPHLESATSLFLTARGAREIDSDPVPAPFAEPEPEPDHEPLSLLDSAFEGGDEEPARPAPIVLKHTVGPRTGRRWVPQAAAVTIVAVAAVAVWTGGGARDPLGGNSFSALRDRPSVALPPASPSPSLSPDPQVPGSPTPAPESTPTGPGSPGHQPDQPPRIPGAPMGLTKTAVDRSSVTLSWRAPADAASVAYYKIFQDGQPIVQTTGTGDKAIGLQPATTYTFAVRAYNRLGQESPPSNSIVATTSAPIHTTFDVPPTVIFGSSFNIGGTGWPCSDVRVLIGGNAVEIGKVDEFGSFDAQVKVHDDSAGPGWVDIIGSMGERMRLTPGKWTMTAACASGSPMLSKQISVVGDEPMSSPSVPPGSPQASG